MRLVIVVESVASTIGTMGGTMGTVLLVLFPGTGEPSLWLLGPSISEKIKRKDSTELYGYGKDGY